MYQSLKSLSGRSSLLLLLLLASMSIASCSKGTPLSLLTGGGPNVAANVQAGKTNNQTVGTTNIMEQKTNSGDVKSSKISADGAQKIVVNEIPPWIILLFGLLCGFVIPSPGEIGRGVVNLVKKKK